ncbi:1,6-dihydroxycyclohexa-2,4-diene-1-carboxylate dehydrogenase [Klebsiella pneumoniae]|uniref:1,6-dihydroxycyclohexa-2,4-diene-1-carboxylate dehydrogenase n=1 Tax=Klebsiella pneumoniae TaxID=573 RepID=A0A2X3EWV6_KLEPN|nr:1,6-dihydroxycyclohexa-2,4-diene-1-carboxylate dehydrogenase [Klebsiella pneumoniae]
MFEAIDRMGEPLTALVNNAGILFTQCTVESLSAERITACWPPTSPVISFAAVRR